MTCLVPHLFVKREERTDLVLKDTNPLPPVFSGPRSRVSLSTRGNFSRWGDGGWFKHQGSHRPRQGVPVPPHPATVRSQGSPLLHLGSSEKLRW